PPALGGEDSRVSSLDDAMIPRAKPVQGLNPRVPDMLAELVMACVQINPDDRPAMEQVGDRLNLIRGKLHAEAVLRKTGHFGRIDPDNGTRGSAASRAPVGVGGEPKHVPPPPLDPGPGLLDDDAEL